MIQACESVDLSCAPVSSEATNATASSSINTTATTTLTSTAASTTSSPDGFSNEADTSACGGGQCPATRGQHSASSFDASSTNLDSQYPPDVKAGFDELCPVCGDKVSGYHYGLLTCESCKGFFKRTVQNKKVYSCVDNRQCPIDKSQRKRCPYCRFQKCLSVGMKLEAVRQDRMRGGRNKFGPMYKRDRALKQQQVRSHHRIMNECEMNIGGQGGPPGSPPDIKPDPALLQASLGLGFNPSALGNHVDISSMAAVMAAAVVGVGGMDGMRDGREGIPTATTTTSGNNYANLSTPVSSAGNRGLPGGGVHGGSSGSPIHLDDGPVAMNLHSTSHQQHNGLHNHSNHNRNNHLSPSHPHSLPQPHHSPVENPYLLQAHPASGYPSHNQTENGTSPGNSMDSLRGFGVSPLPMERPALPSLPPLLREIKANLLEEEEMKQKMLSFLMDTLRQMDGGIGVAEQLLPIICGMVDQLLFLMVEWARSSPFFKEIRVEDQMKLLQHSWSEILILDFVYRQVQEYWGTELILPNGPRLNFDTLDKLGLGDVRVRLFELIKKSRELNLDYNEYMCLKFLILLNPDVSSLENRQYVEESQEKVNAALLEYCLNFYPTLKDKFGQILLRLPEIRIISIQVEEFLYYKHLNNQVPDQTLLTEMLHSRRK